MARPRIKAIIGSDMSGRVHMGHLMAYREYRFGLRKSDYA